MRLREHSCSTLLEAPDSLLDGRRGLHAIRSHWLSAHRTLSDFRAFHLKELSELFVQVVHLAREMGLVKLGRPWRWTDCAL